METKRFSLLMCMALLVLGLLFVLDIALGAVYIPFKVVVTDLFNTSIDDSNAFIIKDFRLPKAITAIFAGAAIAVSGLIMQTYFRNPLAGPFVLGVSSGASLGVALLVMAGSFFAPLLAFGQWGITLASLIGSALVLLAVVFASARIKDGASLLIIGLMFGSFTSAMVSMLQYFSTPELIQTYLFWTFGSLSGVGWLQLQIMIPVLFMALIVSFYLQKRLNLLLLGEAYAASLGLNIKTTRVLIILVTCMLAGTVTAFCGPIAFLGLAVPHLTRTLLKTADHKYLIPACALFGALLLLFCDILTQFPGRDLSLPINAITSLVGAPVVVAIILKRNREAAY